MFQPMPDLDPDQYAALRADIEARGIVVPILVDQHGRILDGHNRKRIADELGMDAPTEVRKVADDDEATDLAVSLNCARRHLSRAQVREVIASELRRRPDAADRAIARRVGCSPSTVGAVRRGVSPGQEPSPEDDGPTGLTRDEAETLTGVINKEVASARVHLAAVALLGLDLGISRDEVLAALTRGQRAHDRTASEPAAQVFRDYVYGPVIDAVISDETMRPSKPVDPEVRADIISILADNLRTEQTAH